jgi:hypothetical protein
MAKLTRKTQKLFAKDGSAMGQPGSAQSGVPTLVPTNDPEVIQALPAYEQGWNDMVIDGDKRPPLEEFNSLKYVNDYQNAYLLQEGIAEYDVATSYYIGGIVKSSSTTILYKSLIDDNLGNPLVDGANWQLMGDLVNIKQATESLLGTAAIADQTETDAGVNDLKTITPLKLAGRLGTIGDDGLAITVAGKFVDSHFQEEESLPEQTTTSTTFVNALTLTTESILAGKYRVGVSFNWAASSNSTDFEGRVQIDNVTNIFQINQEPQEAGASQYIPACGFAYVDLTSGAHVIELDFANEGGNTSYIRDARLEFYRVS